MEIIEIILQLIYTYVCIFYINIVVGGYWEISLLIDIR